MRNISRSACLAAVLITSGISAVGASQLVIQNAPSGTCNLSLASESVTIDTGTGNLAVRIDDPAALENCVAPSVNGPQITQFNVTPQELSAGEQVTITWATNEHATHCRSSGSMPGWASNSRPTSGTFNRTLNSAGTFTAELICWNADGAAQASITVEDGGVDPVVPCDHRPPPTGMSRATNGRMITGTTNSFCSNCGTTWSGMFDHNFASGQESWYYQEPGKYHAIEFNTGPLPVDAFGQVNFTEPHNHAIGAQIRNGRRFVTFSTCPGDFHKSELGQCFRVNNGNGVAPWRGGGSQCILQPNTKYYLNIVHTTSPESNPNPTWECAGNNLGSNLRGCGAMMNPDSTYFLGN